MNRAPEPPSPPAADWVEVEARLAAAEPPDAATMQRVEVLRLDDPGRMQRALAAALAQPALQQQPAVRVHLQLMQGLTLANLRRLDEARELLERVQADAAAAGVPQFAQAAAEAYPWLLIWAGDLGPAAQALRMNFSQALQGGSTSLLVRALEGLAMVASCTSHHDHAMELHRQAEIALQTRGSEVAPARRTLHAHYHCMTLMQSALDAWLAGRQQALRERLQAMVQPLDTVMQRATETGTGVVLDAQRAVGLLHAVLTDPALQEPDPAWPADAQRRAVQGEEYGRLAETIKALRRGDPAAALAHGRIGLEHADTIGFAMQLALRHQMALAHAALGQPQQAFELAQEADAVARRRDHEAASNQLHAAFGAVRRERGLAAALVGHDLRSPLTAIRALAQASPAEAAEAEDGAARLADIERLARRALDYADEFLQGLELQQPDPARLAGVDVPALLAGAVDEVRHAAAAAEVEQQVEPGLELLGDGQLLHRALVNLMLNALQAARERGLQQRLVVRASRVLDGVMLAVRDHGPGIPPASLQRLFEPEGVQSAGAAEPSARGFGLGLRYVQRCARAMGGVVLAMNHPEGGATVALSLPAPQRAARA